MSLLLFLATAEAQAPSLAWKWDGTPVRYVSEMTMKNGSTQWLMARRNTEARAGEVSLSLALVCVGDGDGRVEVVCEIEGAKMDGVGVANEGDSLQVIFREWETELKTADVVLSMDGVGRVRSLDLEGLSRGTAREGVTNELMRMYVTRALAPLDLQLPKNGEVDGSWKQKGSPLALRMIATTRAPGLEGVAITSAATQGGMRLVHEVTGEQDGYPLIQSVGEAVAMISPTVAGSVSQTVGMTLSGQCLFDAERGQIKACSQVINAEPTAQNMSGMYNGNKYLYQTIQFTRVDDFSGYDWVQ
ncbi:MAG: hypothetical protein VX899_10570 [Myxococcota bacterium]|nr:hypothetical protein [Myxococcota bacterium]